MRKRIVAGNWKMNKTPSEAVKLCELLKDKVNTDEIDVVFCVPFVNLMAVKDALKETKIKVGAENLHFKDSGAFTGEISAPMLKEIGVDYVIIGHSERRQYFGETDETVNLKVLKAFEYGITPIVCVGETLEEREDDITIEKIAIQIKKGLKGLTPEMAKEVVIAYEPIWAIGTGKVATKEQAQEVCAEIRKVVSNMFGEDTANEMRIQYGGSVTGASAPELFAMADIDGGLVGGASLKEDFENIVKA
ncbi:MAG: triose-phosphate isomerase [Lachnospirales bacterium]